MNKKTNFLLILLVLLAGGLYFAESRKTEESRKSEEEKRFIFTPAPPPAFKEVKGRDGKGESLHMVKEEGKWSLKEPVQEKGDREAVITFLKALRALKKERNLPFKKGEAKNFGLDTPVLTLTVTEEGGRVRTFSIGDKNPTGEFYYLKVEGESSIHLTAVLLTEPLLQDFYQYRNKTLFSFKEGAPTVIAVTKGGESYEARKKGDQWRLTDLPDFPPVTPYIEKILERLEKTSVRRFYSPRENPGPDQGLDLPSVQFILSGPELPAPQILRIGREEGKDGLFVSHSRKNHGLLSLPKSFLDDLPLTVSDMRDKSLFSFHKSRIRKVEFRYPSFQIVLRKSPKNLWEIDRGRGVPADNVEVDTLFYAMNQEKAIRFLPVKKGEEGLYGLDKPVLTLKVLREDQKTFHLSFGKKEPEGKAIWATKGEEEVFLVSTLFYEQMRQDFASLRYKKILHFQEPEIKKAVIATRKKKYVLNKEEGRWYRGKAPGREVSSATVQMLVWHLQGVDYKSIVGGVKEEKWETYGLKNPPVTISFFNEKEEEIASLSLGRPLQKREEVVCRSGGEEVLYTISVEDTQKILGAINSLEKDD